MVTKTICHCNVNCAAEDRAETERAGVLQTGRSPAAFRVSSCSKSGYIAVGELADSGDEDGHEEAGRGGRRVGQRHQRAGVVGRQVQVVAHETAVHSGEEGGAQRHQRQRRPPPAAGRRHAHQTQSRQQQTWPITQRLG